MCLAGIECGREVCILAVLMLVVAGVALIVGYEIWWLAACLSRRPFKAGRMAGLVHGIFLFAVVLSAYAFLIEPCWLKVQHVEVKTDKLHRTTFTLVQISDLHCDPERRNEEAVVSLVNQLQPDIIVFTGDAVNSPEVLSYFKDVLTRLKASLGKFAVKGNWDVWRGKELDYFSGTGFQELAGNSVRIRKNDEDLILVGFSPGQLIDLNLFRQIPANLFSVCLSHYPGINEEIGRESADLFLSGHTHGGQVAVPVYGAIITLSKYGKKYEAGAYRLNNNSLLYVNRGVGMEGGRVPRIRFMSRPEIAVFHIK